MDAEPIKPARIGPWTAIGLMIAAFAILEFLLPMARAAIVSHLSIVTPRDKVAVSAVGSIVLVWLLFGAAWIILGLRGQNLRNLFDLIGVNALYLSWGQTFVRPW